jgi:hypothetical protein
LWSARHRVGDVVDAGRLEQVVGHLRLHGGDGALYPRTAGQNDDGQVGIQLPGELHHFDPIHARHEDIQHHGVAGGAFEQRQRLASGAGFSDAIPQHAQAARQGRPNLRLVVHDQQARCRVAV